MSSAPSSPLARCTSQRASCSALSMPTPASRSAASSRSVCQATPPVAVSVIVDPPGPGESDRLGEAAGLLVGHECVADLVQLARQHLVEPVESEADAVVRYAVLLEVVGPHLLGAAPAAHLAPTCRRRRGGLAVLLGLEEPGPQHLQRLGAVLDLA